VKNVWPVKTFSLPGDTVHAVGPSVGALATSSALAKRQAPVAGEGFAPHVMTQVDKMRAAGFRGKGIKIAIIDTGVSLCSTNHMRAAKRLSKSANQTY